MTTEKQKMNIPRLTVTKTISKLANIFVSASKKNIPFSQCPTAFLWGSAGIGKSQGVLQLAKIVEVRAVRVCRQNIRSGIFISLMNLLNHIGGCQAKVFV